MLRLHFHPNSTFSRRIRIWIAEKDLADQFVMQPVRMERLAHRRPDFLALNPYGRVPVLEVDGVPIYESASILYYLEGRFSEPPLQPADPVQRARMQMIMQNCDRHYADAITAQIFARRFLPAERQDPAAFAAARQKADQHYAILSPLLGNQEYLLGAAFSLADIAYMPFLHFAHLLEVDLPSNLASWQGRLAARASAGQTVPEK